MTTALERGEGSASRPGRSLSPGKTRYSLYRRLGGPQGRSGQVRKISPPTGIRSPDHPARSQSLYRLSYPAHGFIRMWAIINARRRRAVLISGTCILYSPVNICRPAYLFKYLIRNFLCGSRIDGLFNLVRCNFCGLFGGNSSLCCKCRTVVLFLP